jgi:hypothetical protein
MSLLFFQVLHSCVDPSDKLLLEEFERIRAEFEGVSAKPQDVQA